MHSSTQLPNKKEKRCFALVLGAYALSRLLILYFQHPLYIYTYPLEEPYRGALAAELLRGLALPLWSYSADHYAGGAFVIAAVASVFFKFFGITAFALKLTSITWMTTALAFWYSLCRKYLGKIEARIFGLLFIFSPPLLTRYGLVTLGDHTETILLSGSALWFLLESLTGKQKNKERNAMISGIICGFGVWFAYTMAVFTLALLIFWLLKDPKAWKGKPFSSWIIGLAIGFSPWFSQNQFWGFQGIYLFDKPIWEHFNLRYLWRNSVEWKHSFPVHLIASFAMGDMAARGGPSTRTVDILYGFLYGLPVLSAFSWLKQKQSKVILKWKTWNPVLRFTLLYLFVFGAVHQLSDFSALRYVIPCHPFILLLVAASIGFLIQQKPVNVRWAYLYGVCFLGVSILSHASLFSLRWVGEIFKIPGANYAWIVQSPVCFKADTCMEAYNKLKSKLSAQRVHELQLGAAFATMDSLALEPGKVPQDLLRHFPSLQFEQRYFYFLGTKIMAINSPHTQEVLHFAEKASLTEEQKKWFFLGVLRVVGDVPAELPEALSQNSSFTEIFWRLKGKIAVIKGLEERSQEEWMNHFEKIVQEIPLEFQDEFTEGAGMGLLYQWNLEVVRPRVSLSLLRRLAPHYQNLLLRGVGRGFEQDWQLDHAVHMTWIEESLTDGLTLEEKMQVQAGKEEFTQDYEGQGLDLRSLQDQEDFEV